MYCQDGWVCFGCGKNAHKMRDFPTLATKGKQTNQDPHDGLNPNAQKMNYLNVLQDNKGANPK